MPTAVVVIPTKNEQASIAAVIEEVRSSLRVLHYDRIEILVVDDSRDATRERAEAAGASVLIGGGEGLGSAMYRGLKAALAFEPDIILSIDGDGQTAVREEIGRFVAAVTQGGADLVLGSRFKESGLVGYRYRFINRVGTRILTYMLNRKTGLDLTDSHGGIRAMVPVVARELEMIGTHTYVQETIIDAVEKGFKVVELPSAWRMRQHGNSRVVGSIPRYIFYTLPVLLLRSGHHMQTLYMLGLSLIGFAFLYFFFILYQEDFSLRLAHRTPGLVLIALLVLAGMQFFFFGVLLQLVTQIKRAVDRGRVSPPLLGSSAERKATKERHASNL
ncbi:glycosyltransferase family 2 protein [Afifella pfennigii]|uniref:glycosyltransferase family 2 protein n=1 Tax=Afifella pfennigii TaxID=209897 RepID=UPI00047B0056|nr:glycosyltransferase family 2 protein [Afifella pfennigii]